MNAIESKTMIFRIFVYLSARLYSKKSLIDLNRVSIDALQFAPLKFLCF